MKTLDNGAAKVGFYMRPDAVELFNKLQAESLRSPSFIILKCMEIAADEFLRTYGVHKKGGPSHENP